MAIQIQLRGDTAANWARVDTVLAQREFGYVIDTGDFKIGDGVTSWNFLAPWSPNAIQGASKLVSIGDNGFVACLLANATSTAGTSELFFTVGQAATNITALWTHWYTEVTSAPWKDTDPSGAIAFSASLQVVSSTNPGTTTGTLYRLTFNGRTQVTLDPGGRITADPLGLSVAPGDVVAVRTYLSSGTAYPSHYTQGGYQFGVGGFVSTTDLTAPGSAAITSSFGYYYGPAALLGQAQGAGNAKSVMLLGDSIAAPFGDQWNFTTAVGSSGGFAMRALEGVGGLLNAAIPGDEATAFQTTNGSFRRLSNAPRCNSAIIEYGLNDLTAGASVATLQAANLYIATELVRLGVTKVFLTTLTPSTTSTDGWATTTNQTVQNTMVEPLRVAYNTWVRAGCPVNPTTQAPVAVGTPNALLAGSFGHPITGFFDTASKVESSLNSGLWVPATRVATGSITASTGVLTSSTANFLSTAQESGGDLGSGISVTGAGAAGVNLVAFIQSVTSSTQVNLSSGASTTVSNVPISIGITTLDGSHPSPRGHYLMSQAINTAVL